MLESESHAGSSRRCGKMGFRWSRFTITMTNNADDHLSSLRGTGPAETLAADSKLPLTNSAKHSTSKATQD